MDIIDEQHYFAVGSRDVIHAMYRQIQNDDEYIIYDFLNGRTFYLNITKFRGFKTPRRLMQRPGSEDFIYMLFSANDKQDEEEIHLRKSVLKSLLTSDLIAEGLRKNSKYDILLKYF